jgi:hypothetical protein
MQPKTKMKYDGGYYKNTKKLTTSLSTFSAVIQGCHARSKYFLSRWSGKLNSITKKGEAYAAASLDRTWQGQLH